MTGWGIVRYGDRYVLVRGKGAGQYVARPRLRQFGDRLLEGELASILPGALSYRTETGARSAAAADGLRPVDRWRHLDIMPPT